MSLENGKTHFTNETELSLDKMYIEGIYLHPGFPFIDSCLTFIKSLLPPGFSPLCQRREMHHVSISRVCIIETSSVGC